MLEDLRLLQSMIILRRKPFFMVLALIFPILFSLLIQGFSMLLTEDEVMFIGKESSQWVDSLYLPGSNIPYSDKIGLSLSNINERLVLSMLGLKAMIYYVLYFVLIIVLSAGFLGSWKQVFKDEKPTFLTFCEDVRRYSAELFIQSIIIMMLAIPFGLVLSSFFSELGGKIVMVMLIFFLTTTSLHIVFHNMGAWEGIKYGVQYVFTHKAMLLGLYAFSIVISTMLYFADILFGSFTPIVIWIVMSFVGPLLVGALSIYVWQHPPKDF